MTNERTAVYYGQVELIPGIICDGYVLDDGTAVMSERGTADLLGMSHTALQSMATKLPSKVLKYFFNKDFSMATNLVEVNAENSPYRGRNIVVHSTKTIGALISAYALALAHRVLRENQRHIGERCTILAVSLMETALEAAIREACGLPIHIQQTAQQHYIDAVGLILKAGFIC
jgi:hypothetical protein